MAETCCKTNEPWDCNQVKYGMKTSHAKLIFVTYTIQHTWECVWATGAVTLLCTPGQLHVFFALRTGFLCAM